MRRTNPSTVPSSRTHPAPADPSATLPRRTKRKRGKAGSEWNVRRPSGFLGSLLELADLMDPEILVTAPGSPKSARRRGK